MDLIMNITARFVTLTSFQDPSTVVNAIDVPLALITTADI